MSKKNKEQRRSLSRTSQHWIARIVCLLAAVVVWLFVMRVAPPTRDEVYRDVPVSIRHSETMSDYTGRIDSTISVRVYGTKDMIQKYEKTDISAYVKIADLVDAKPTVGKVYEMKIYFELPDGLTVGENYTVPMTLEARVEAAT